ncbi:MAG: polysaccharide deacetylase family protein [Clostridium sp.]
MKRKIIVIVVVVLVFISTLSGYFIRRQYYQHKSLTEKNSKIVENINATEILKGEAQKTPDIEYKTENTDAIVLVAEAKIKHNDKGLPVLMYHSIGYEAGNTVRVPKENFKKQMKYLKDTGYVTLTLDEAYDFFAKNKPVPEKSVVLTFDDGYVDNYVEALPILNEFEFKATFFVITGAVGKSKNYMNIEQLKEMESSGMDIQSHTVHHKNLKELSYEKQLETLKESKNFLEKTLNKRIKYFAYPYGEYSKESLKAVKEAGYTMAFATAGRWSDKTDGILTLDRVFISGSANLDVFIDRISNPNYKF